MPVAWPRGLLFLWLLAPAAAADRGPDGHCPVSPEGRSQRGVSLMQTSPMGAGAIQKRRSVLEEDGYSMGDDGPGPPRPAAGKQPVQSDKKVPVKAMPAADLPEPAKAAAVPRTPAVLEVNRSAASAVPRTPAVAEANKTVADRPALEQNSSQPAAPSGPPAGSALAVEEQVHLAPEKGGMPRGRAKVLEAARKAKRQAQRAARLTRKAWAAIETGLQENSRFLISSTIIVVLVFLIGVISLYIMVGKGAASRRAAGLLSSASPAALRSAAGSAQALSASTMTKMASAEEFRSKSALLPDKGGYASPNRRSVTAQRSETRPGTGGTQQLPPAVLPTTTGPDAYFCTDLVVPRNCECVLMVPIKPISTKPFEITDTHGNSVLYVEAARDPSVNKPRFLLRAGDGATLAKFGPVEGGETSPRDGGDNQEFLLMRGQGDIFARLKRTDQQEQVDMQKQMGFTLRTRTELRLYFWGSFNQRAVNVTDDEGRLLATTEPATEDIGTGLSQSSLLQRQEQRKQPHYLLRVAPLMDVGLVLCGLLCIDHLTKVR